MKIDIEERVLHFKQPAGTSRGVYTERKIWLVKMTDRDAVGIGECASLPKLSCDDIPHYAEVLRRFCDEVERSGQLDTEALRDYPSMLFGLETAMLSFAKTQHSTPFSKGEVGIPINGLVWMGTYEEMKERMIYELMPLIKEYLAEGYLLKAKDSFCDLFLKETGKLMYE